MEKLEKKHNHKLTDLLKVGIFGIMLTLPFAVYCPNALYYGTNEYAVAQEKKQQEPVYYETNEVNQLSDLIVGNIYLWNNDFDYTGLTQSQFGLGVLVNEEIKALNSNFVLNTEVKFYFNSINNALSINDNDGHYSLVSNKIFYFVVSTLYNNDVANRLVESITSYNNLVPIPNEYTEVTYTMSIAESMNIAWQQTWESNMFNWTKTSILKQGLDSFTGVFGVTDTSYFTNLIVYELIMVAIYIVIDIVIEMFKWLTHLIGAK